MRKQREHAPIAIKASGISCVIAKSFARIFYRNAINIGLPILECVEASERIDDKDEVEINFNTGEIINKTKNENLSGTAVSCVYSKHHAAQRIVKCH